MERGIVERFSYGSSLCFVKNGLAGGIMLVCHKAHTPCTALKGSNLNGNAKKV